MKNEMPPLGEEELAATSSTALELVSAAGPRALDLINAWVKAGNVEAVDEAASGGSGSVRKAARRGLNILQSRGIRPPAQSRKGSLTRPKSNVPERLAYLLAPDGRGTGGLILAQRTAAGRYQSFAVYYTDGRGIVRIEQTFCGLGKLKERMREAVAGSGQSYVEVPWGWAQHRVRELRKWHAAQGVAEPLGLGNAGEFFGADDDGTPIHPFDDEGLELASDDAANLARDSSELHQWPEFRSWLPSDHAMSELLQKLGQRVPPQAEGGTPPQLGDALEEELLAATDRYFTPERRAQLVRLMKDSALSVLAHRGEPAALQVAAVIHVMDAAGLITNPPRDVGFLVGFFRKAVALMAAQQDGKLRLPVPPGRQSQVEAPPAQA